MLDAEVGGEERAEEGEQGEVEEGRARGDGEAVGGEEGAEEGG